MVPWDRMPLLHLRLELASLIEHHGVERALATLLADRVPEGRDELVESFMDVVTCDAGELAGVAQACAEGLFLTDDAAVAVRELLEVSERLEESARYGLREAGRDNLDGGGAG